MPTKWIKVTTVVVVGLVAAGIAFAAGHRSVDKPKPAASNETTSPTTGPVTGGLVEFRDEKNGFAISYPRNWLRLESTDPNVVVVVSEKPPQQNTGGSILARTITLANPVGPDQLAEAKKISDAIVTQGLHTSQLPMFTQPKPESELAGLVAGVPNPNAAPKVTNLPWYESPKLLGGGALLITLVLSLIFL